MLPAKTCSPLNYSGIQAIGVRPTQLTDILLQTPAGNLSQIMHHINGAYTKLFQISTCQLCRPMPFELGISNEI